MKYILLFLFTFTSIFSQSVIITDVKTNDYPDIDVNFLVVDESGNAIQFDDSFISLKENELDRIIQNVECNSDYTNEPISLALTLDVSTSMNDTIALPSKRRIDAVKEAASKLINVLHPNSEISLILFSTEVKIEVPLTTDKSLVNTRISDIEDPFGATYISEAFLDSDNGIIKSLENAQYKKIIVFMTDGQDNDLEKAEISKRLSDNNITLYSLSSDSFLELDLINMTEESGGMVFNNINGNTNLEDTFTALGNIVSGIEPCQLTYISKSCDQIRNIKLFYDNSNPDSIEIRLDRESLIEYEIVNNNQKIGRSDIDENYYFISLISNRDNLKINDILSNDSDFELISPQSSFFPITLNKDEILNLQFETKLKDVKINDFFNVESNSCKDGSIYLKYSPEITGLNVLTPNGGEEYFINSNADLGWEDDGYKSTYSLSYSTNKGAKWLPLVSNYNDLDFPWQSIPGPESNSALFKVEKNIVIDSIINTIGFGQVSEPLNDFRELKPLGKDKYIALIDAYNTFIYNDFTLGATDFEVPSDYSGTLKTLMLILDNNLKVLDYKALYAPFADLNLTTLADDIYITVTNFDELYYDTLSYKPPKGESEKYGAILKIDSQLKLEEHQLFSVDDFFNLRSEFIVDFESIDNSLHLLGIYNEYVKISENKVISSFSKDDNYFLLEFDKTLNLVDLISFNKLDDNFDFIPRGIEAISDDSVAWWGTGDGKYFDLDSNHRGISAISSYRDSSLYLSSYMQIKNSFDFRFIDFKYYKGNEYWLYFALDTIKVRNGEPLLANEVFNTSLLSFNSNNEVNWRIDLDKFGITKNLIIYDSEEIVVGGLTSSTFKVDEYTILKDGNTQFLGSFDLYTGNFNWLKTVPETTYRGLFESNNESIVLSGNLYRETDFGNGFKVNVNKDSGNTNEYYLWSLEVDNNPYYDISDSLWSIVSPGFEYIDTVDFGNVYSGSIKDTLVVDFLEVTDKDSDIIIENINIEDAGYTVDINTPFKLEENRDLKIILNVDIAGNGLAKGVITTNLGKFNFYVNSNEVELRYRPFYHNDSLVIDFGEVLIGNSKNEVHNVIANLGDAIIGIDSIVIENNAGGNYSYNILSGNKYVLSNDTLITDFIFSPNFTGTHDSRYLFYTDIDRTPFIINVTGIGISNDTVDVRIEIDSSYSDADKYIDMQTKIKFNDNPASLQLEKIEVDIEYNATLLIPFRFENKGIVENKIRKLTIEVDKEDITSGLSSNRFYTTIGNSISTDINITEVRAYNVLGDKLNEFKYEASDGYFELTNICYTDGNYRLYSDSNPTGLNLYSENGEYFVNYNLIEDGFTKISLYDTDGDLKSHLVDGMMNKGAYNAEINTENIASGSYIVQLETENIIISKMLIIVK